MGKASDQVARVIEESLGVLLGAVGPGRHIGAMLARLGRLESALAVQDGDGQLGRSDIDSKNELSRRKAHTAESIVPQHKCKRRWLAGLPDRRAL